MRKCLVLIALFLTSCGGGSPSATSSGTTISMEYKTLSGIPVARDIQVKKGIITPLEITLDNEKVVRYIIDLADFEYEGNNPRPSDEKQTLVSVQLYGQKDSAKDSPVKPGTYELVSPGAPATEKMGKINNVLASISTGGKIDEYSFTFGSKGNVKVTDSSAGSVSGEIDLAQENGGKIKGTFNAIIKK